MQAVLLSGKQRHFKICFNDSINFTARSQHTKEEWKKKWKFLNGVDGEAENCCGGMRDDEWKSY